jgi:2-phospho-L-lactate guanylyltransferase
MRTFAVLPVKSFARAKRRLEERLTPALRESLAEAMFCDVLGVVAQSSLIDEILVVTADARAQRTAQAHHARVLEDREEGHNPAAALGVRVALEGGAERALLIPGDCPALDAEELEALLAHPRPRRSVVIVPDRHGTGTNALLLAPPDVLASSFGPGSCERHLAQARERGVDPELVQVPTLALDIDTPEDLEVLASRGALHAHTREMLSRC